MKNSNPSQAQIILDYLLSGEPITALEALEKFACFRLAARIHELRNDGHNIEEVTIKRNGKAYAQYFIRTFTLQYA
jgi:hypothetical protein